MMTRETIVANLKELIVQGLRIEDTTAADLSDDQPLIGGDIAIDSVDILQLIVEIERSFSIKLVSGEFVRDEWESVGTLAAAIERKLQADSGAGA